MRAIDGENIQNLFAGNIRRLLIEAKPDYNCLYEIRLRAGRCKEGLERHIPQHLAAADSGHGAALVGDGGVLIGQVGVVCAGIQDAEGKACLREIYLHRLHIGVGRVGKVHRLKSKTKN